MNDHKFTKIVVILALLILPVFQFSVFSQNEEDLIDAIIKNDEKKVFYFLKAGVNPNYKSYENVTPIMFAAESGYLYIVKQLIAYGADVNAEPNSGTTAIIAASKKNNIDIVELLLQNSANVNAVDQKGYSALSYAAAYGFPKLAWLLCSYGAKTENINNDNSPMILAAYYGDNEIINILLEFAADINVKDDEGFTPLMIAAQNGLLETVKLLVDSGANSELTNSQGYNALKLAVANDKKDVVEYLIESGALVSDKNSDTNTAFDIAEQYGNSDMLIILKEKSNIGNAYKVKNKKYIELNDEFGGFDYFLGGSFNYSISRYNIDFSAHFNIRPYRKKIIVDQTENFHFQYREFRAYNALSVSKKFTIYSSGFNKTGVFVTIGEYFSYGNYKGVNKGFYEFITVPQVGFYTQNSKTGVKLSYKYLTFNNSDNFPHIINFGVYFFLGKKKYILLKELNDF